jgi:bifunctional enzyme CysN/CysC
MDIDTLHREPAGLLSLNDIGRVEVTTSAPVFYDPYGLNRATGSFILADPYTNVTVAAGMIRGPVNTADELFGAPEAVEKRAVSPGAVWEEWNIPLGERESRNGHRAAVVWFTGMSGAGKSTIARELERRLFDAGCQTMLLDGDQLRHGLCGDLGFSPADRAENVRRAGEVARLFYEQGSVVLCTFVSPYQADRDRVRALVPEDRFIEVHVDCSVDELRRRDTKGLYARAESASGGMQLTGVDAPYEPPAAPELRADTERQTLAESVGSIHSELVARGLVPGHPGQG